MKVNILFFMIFIILGAVMIILSILFKISSYKRFKKCINTVKGKVIKYTLWNNNGVHFPIVEYVVNGISYAQRLKYGWIITKASSFNKIESKINSDANDTNLVISKNSHISTNALEKTFPIGTELDVYYDPNNPKLSYVMRFVNNPCIIVFFLVGIIFVILVIVALFVMPNNLI